jgi:secreted PhoX family phosphatase
MLHRTIALYLLVFLYVFNPPVAAQTPALNEFTSVVPSAQTGVFQYPSTHSFQWLFGEGDHYTIGPGNAKGKNDFTGFVSIDGRSDTGFVCINHETFPGGVSVLNVKYDSTLKLWRMIASREVDHNLPIGTVANCSGTITPWNTMITCEEFAPNVDFNFDGYEDYGWCFEIDPVTAKVMQYGTGSPQKLWALGNMAHENVVIANDHKTVYYGEDGGTSCLYKFIADQPGDLTSGTVYGLKLNDEFSGGVPTGTTATWIQLPNTTKFERNDMNDAASDEGCNDFGGIEDADINPVTGYIYFASKLNGRVYCFRDNGLSVDDFHIYVGGMSYEVTTPIGISTVSWGGGNDNLAFDDEGNLWVTQDGGDNYIWYVGAGHTQQQPKVSVFGIAPAGSEPTGITLTPDKKFIFMSFMHPDPGNFLQTDATGKMVRFNRSATIVFARKEILNFQPTQNNSGGISVTLLPDPADNYFYLRGIPEIKSKYTITIYSVSGQLSGTITGVYLNGETPIVLPQLSNGVYICTFSSSEASFRKRFSVYKNED